MAKASGVHEREPEIAGLDAVMEIVDAYRNAYTSADTEWREDAEAAIQKLARDHAAREYERGCMDTAKASVGDVSAPNNPLRPFFEQYAAREAQPLAEALEQGIEAVRLTRDYAGHQLLPNVEGWSHYDFMVDARAALTTWRTRVGGDPPKVVE